MELDDRTEMAINRFKNYILELAARNETIYKKDFTAEQYQYWKFFFSLVEADGYVKNAWPITTAFRPVLTDSGRVFYDLGGYDEVDTSYPLSKSIREVAKPVLCEILKQVVSDVSVELVKKVIQ